MSFYKCPVLFFRVQYYIAVLERKTFKLHRLMHGCILHIETRKKIDSAMSITEQAIAIAIVLNHVEQIVKSSALTENATEILRSRQDKIAGPLHD